MCKLGKIRRRHWKERFKIITIAKFESNLLKANGDRAPRSCEIFQTFCRDGHWCWGASLGAQFSQVWGHNFPKYTLARVRRIQSTCHLQHLYLAMLPIWRRFFHYGVDRFSLTGPCQKLKKPCSDNEHRALLSERLGQAMEGWIETGHDILPC